MVSESYAQWSSCNNPLANPIREQNEFTGPQGIVKRLDTNSNEALTFSETLNLLFVPPTKDFFMKFMKAFMESIQA